MRVIIVLLAGLAAVTAVPAFPQRVMGGTTTTIAQYPANAALLYSWNGVSFGQACGGTIISSRSILTAAHCSYGDSASRWRMRVGSTWANSGGVVYSSSSIISHPSYNKHTMDSDIAVMSTTSTISFNNAAKAAAIASSNYIIGDNQVVWATGWGTVSIGGAASDQLRHVQIYTVNLEICRSLYAAYGATVTNNMLCSGLLDVGGRDQCQSDSGSPLYHNGVVVGVYSWGFGCALPQFPGVNARVSRYTSWIQAVA